MRSSFSFISTSCASTAATRSSISSATAPTPIVSWPDRAFGVLPSNLRRGCDSVAGASTTGRSPAGGSFPAAGERPERASGYPWVAQAHPVGIGMPTVSWVYVVRGPPLTTTDQRGGHRQVMPAAEPRYCVAEVTEEALDGWRDFADRHGVDRTALAEVIGLRLAGLSDPLPRLLEQWVREARDLKNERRRRG